jgi:outer membrane lipoprotein-sorting protein
MFKFSISVILMLCAGISFGQQDPEAKKILDRVAEKNKAYSTIQADFELTISNRRDDRESTSSGHIKLKGEMYYMETMGTQVFCDGKQTWSYMQDIKEVTISEANSHNGDILENPAKIFDFYNRDFKYRLVGEAKLDAGWTYEIDLFPNSLDQPYSRFKLLILRDSYEIYMIKALGKDGVDYGAHFKNYKYNETLPDALFTFDATKHKGVEVIDLRF